LTAEGDRFTLHFALQLRQRLPVFEYVFPEVAFLLESGRHRLDGEVAYLEATRDLLPGHGRRYACARLGAHAVDRCRRFAARVLLPVNIDLILLALGEPAFNGGN